MTDFTSFTTSPEKAHCTNDIISGIAPILPAGAGTAGGAAPVGGGLVSVCISDRSSPRKIYANIKLLPGGAIVRRRSLSAGIPPRASGRGVICGFSPASRRRMSHKLMALDWSMLMPSVNGRNYSSFVTLTYPDAFPTDREKWKRDLHTLGKRIKRKYPGRSYIWKEELKKRKSGQHKGELAPHFHLLTYDENGLDLPEFRAWLSQAWYEVVASNDEKHLGAGTQAKPLYGTVGELMSYCAKYLGKDFETDFETGRCWGEHGAMPYGDVYSFDIDYIEFCRRIRRWGRSSSYLSTRMCPNGMMVFGEVAQLTVGIVASGVSPPDVLYREWVTKKTVAQLKAHLSIVRKRREVNARVVAEFQARYPAKGGEV